MIKRVRTGLLLLAVMCLCVMWKGTVQSEEAGKTVRVYIPLMNDSGFVSYENGRFSGYYIDYLTEIAKYTSWQYEFVPVESYEAMQAACERGDFDLMTGIVYSEEYDEEYFDYPQLTVGAKRYVLAVPKDSGLVPDMDYAYLRGLKAGFANNESGRELAERFRSFSRMYGIRCADSTKGCSQSVELVPIEPAEWKDQVASGEISGILASDAFCLSQDMYAITTFGLDQIYFVSPNGKEEIVSQLGDALKKINDFDPEYHNKLYEKYFEDSLQYTASYTETERDYLEQKHTFEVALLEHCAPYSYQNEEGKPAGMITQVFEQIAAQTGQQFAFHFTFYASLTEAETAVKSGICDINGMSLYSLLLQRESDERRSTSFYEDTFMYYRSSKRAVEKESARLVLPELPESLLDSLGITREKVGYGRAYEALSQVQEGKSYYTVMLSRVGDYYKSYYGYHELSSYAVIDGEVMFCFAYAPDVEQSAVEIIDKCLLGMDRDALNHYVTSVSLFEHKEHSFKDYIQEHFAVFALLIILVLCIICALLLVIIFNINKHSRDINALLYVDDVTGGSTYRRFMKEAERARKAGGKWLITYINISSFKYINDVFGYRQGNEVLQAVNRYLEKQMQVPGLLIARVYADRFVALMPYQDLDKAKERLRVQLDEFEHVSRKQFPSFNLWIKVGAYALLEKDDLQKAVNFANYAVDEIQKIPKSDYIFYDEAMHDKVLAQKEIEKDMRGAMENGEFEAFYQPKYNIENREMIGAEALVRWRHPQKGLLSPGLFIPIFEKNHFIIQVDFYVFECVCRLLQERIRNGSKLFPISSNFSRLHLNQPKFVNQLNEIVQRYQVPPQYLEIEITETVALENFEVLIDTVKELKENGFLVSIDDFGSGHSSIQLLYKLPIDVLKFDKAFVDHKDVSDLETELIDSIIQVSHKNGIRIICEGVETVEQEEFVRNHNCTYVQGFLYSRPVTEEAFKELLLSEN